MDTLRLYRERLKHQADKFRRELDALMQSCDCVKDLDQCDGCPLNQFCFEEESLSTIWSEVSINAIAEFLEYADDVCNAEEEEEIDYEGRYADDANDQAWLDAREREREG